MPQSCRLKKPIGILCIVVHAIAPSMAYGQYYVIKEGSNQFLIPIDETTILTGRLFFLILDKGYFVPFSVYIFIDKGDEGVSF